MRFLILIILPFYCLSQTDVPIIKKIQIEQGDTFFTEEIQAVEILDFKTIKEKNYYHRLKIKTLKVYPYALLASRKLDSIQQDLKQIPKKRKKKKYTKEIEKWIKEELTEELKKLTQWEGRILIKLIYRETGFSTYDLAKKLRGNIRTFVWQKIAKIYNNDLKTTYQPISNKEDRLIEHIILEFENREKNKFSN